MLKWNESKEITDTGKENPHFTKYDKFGWCFMETKLRDPNQIEYQIMRGKRANTEPSWVLDKKITDNQPLTAKTKNGEEVFRQT